MIAPVYGSQAAYVVNMTRVTCV